MRKLRRRAAPGFTLLELIVALSLSVFVLVGIISIATTMISYQLDSVRKGNTEGSSITALTAIQRDIRAATYLQCPGGNAGCVPASNTGDKLSGCTNWSAQISGADKRIDPNYANVASVDECTGANNVMSFLYCTPNSSTDPRLIRYVKCGTTCSIPAPASCGAAAGGATMSVIVGANGATLSPGFRHMDGLGYYYERADDISGVGVHFIVGVGTPTVAGQAGRAQVAMPVSYKFNVRVGMNKSYNDSND
jgi:type II secretory pathway pseudopilin PulG